MNMLPQRDKYESFIQETAGSIHEFLTLLAVCHTVVPEKEPNGTLTYQASSPGKLDQRHGQIILEKSIMHLWCLPCFLNISNVRTYQ